MRTSLRVTLAGIVPLIPILIKIMQIYIPIEFNCHFNSHFWSIALNMHIFKFRGLKRHSVLYLAWQIVLGFFLNQEQYILWRYTHACPSKLISIQRKLKTKSENAAGIAMPLLPWFLPAKQTTAPSMLCDWSGHARDAFAAGRAIWWLRSTLLSVSERIALLTSKACSFFLALFLL